MMNAPLTMRLRRFATHGVAWHGPMQINLRMAGLLIVAVAGEYVAMRWMAQTWLSGSEEAHVAREAPATTNSIVVTGNDTATAAPAQTSSAADWHPTDGWGGQAAAAGQNGSASAAPPVVGTSAAGTPVQASVQASMTPPPQAPAAQPSPAPADSSNTSRNAGP